MFAHLSTRSAPYTSIHSRHAESNAQNETPNDNCTMSYAPATSEQPFSASGGDTGTQVRTKPLAAVIAAVNLAAIVPVTPSGGGGGLKLWIDSGSSAQQP